MLRLAESEAGWAVRLQRDYDPSIPEFHGDADRLTQAVWNLVRNAIQAGAGNITLRTRVEHGVRIAEQLHTLALRLESPTTAVAFPRNWLNTCSCPW